MKCSFFLGFTFSFLLYPKKVQLPCALSIYLSFCKNQQVIPRCSFSSFFSYLRFVCYFSYLIKFNVVFTFLASVTFKLLQFFFSQKHHLSFNVKQSKCLVSQTKSGNIIFGFDTASFHTFASVLLVT